jgi:hypothetical protein
VSELRDEVLAAIGRRDWEGLRPLLHPYVRWRRADGSVLRGRTKVMAWLAAADPPRAPASYELRDGQLYRWTDSG